VASNGPTGKVASARAARFVRLVPDVPAIHRRFDYSVPPDMADAIRVGSRVRIELHGRRVGAWVVEDDVTPPDGIVPKPIALSSGEGPPPSVVSLAEWAAWRWAGPMSSFLGTASPPRVVRRHRDSGSGAPGDLIGSGPLPGKVMSTGGGAVGIVAEALVDPSTPSVVRLAPALDATLIVLELVHRLGAAGVLVLAPSHVRAGQLATRLRQAGAPVALLPDAWEAASGGRHVVVGTRAAAWAPLPRVTAVVVLDAHDEAYREERAPTWSAVDVVVERLRRVAGPVVLVTPCPRVTQLAGATVVRTGREVERRGWPAVEVVDRTGDDPRTGLFSERLVRLLRSVLDAPTGRVVCILNRTGRARLLACAHCGALARCTRCGGPVAQHQSGGVLRCRRCGDSRPAMCAECDSTRLKVVRIGVSRATEELSALVGVEAVEVTGDSQGAVEESARLVVGTEAALHRTPRADAVALLDIDQHLLAPRFAAGEETLALLSRAARLVGGRDTGGRVLVQTRLPDHEVLRAAVHANPSILSDAEDRIRASLALPPYGAIALLRGPSAADYASGLRAFDGVSVSSTDPDRWMVRAGDHQKLCDALAAVPRPSGRLRVEVDPGDV
jgi:primosomal protein N' (replication factor Y) (superfamily II helicase)